MKKLLISMVCVAVFFLGLGGLVNQAGAKFKSDDRALELVRLARIALGGDEAINNVRSLSIKGKQTMTFDVQGVSKTEQGDVEIALQLPNQLMKTMKFGHGEGTGANTRIVEKEVNVVVPERRKGEPASVTSTSGNNGKQVAVEVQANGSPEKIIVKKADGTTEEIIGTGEAQEFTTSDGKKVFVRRADSANGAVFNTPDGKTVTLSEEVLSAGQPRQNEMLRLTLALLMSAPQGIDVAYAYGGEVNVDTTSCNVLNAVFGGETFKIFLDKSSNLPVAMNYRGMKMPKVIHTKMIKGESTELKGSPKDMRITVSQSPMEIPLTDFQVKFSDYRSVNGVQFPHLWTTTSAGEADETFEISNYEVNSPNIAEKFKQTPGKVMVRTKKPE